MALGQTRARKQAAICVHLSHGLLSHARGRAACHQGLRTGPGDAHGAITQLRFCFPIASPGGQGGPSQSSGSGGHSLCVQMGPSQPSLQTHVKDSPLTTQVPPLWQGLGRQLLFRAARQDHAS